nr:MAG TPA: DNA-directed RNA polymerase II subunit [Caudoviricetes sp.]
MTRVWICPRCGREAARSEGQTSRKCICGSMMDAAVKKDDSKCILERLED